MKALNKLIKAEETRQNKQINLIASENFIPQNILNVLASKLSNKYAEGFGDKRWYAGIGYVNAIEDLTIEQAKRVFGASDYDVNVQALSGSPSNLVIYNAFLEPGDTILSLALFHGGHLSHGGKNSIVSKFYNIKYYNTTKDDKQEINFNQIEKVIKENLNTSKPIKMLVAGYSSYCRDIDYKQLHDVCQKYGVHLHIDFSHTAGLIAAKLMNDPFKYADSLVCTTHKTLRGPRGALVFSHAGDKVNTSVFPGLQGGPHMNNVAAIGATLCQVDDKYYKYQQKTIENREILMSHFPKEVLFQQGSDNHMFIVKNIKDGGVVEKALEQQGIIVNKSTLGTHQQGIRIGTPFVTSQNISKKKLNQVGKKIMSIIRDVEGDDWGRL